MSQPRIRITSIGGSGDGTPGDPGDSAYQVAVNNGFIGTEQEWLDSLVGADGTDGADGANGNDGADGANGNDGAGFGIYYLGNYNPNNGYLPDIAVVRGSDGQLYLAKASGQLGDPIDYQTNGQWEIWIPKGADGVDGADGLNGSDGAKGDQGEPGLAGLDGTNGADALWNFTGEWLNGVDYAAGDLVTFNGSLYYTATGVYSSYSPGYPGADWVLAASKGEDGTDGADGANGIDGSQGPKGDQGDPGPAGADGLDGIDGIGMPVGGEAGQILAKDTATDYDFIWIDNYANWTSQLKHEVKLGEAIAKGQAVYVSSGDGTNMIVSKASNASESTSSKTLGLLETGGNTNAKVKVITEGLLSGLDTGSALDGDPVWLGTSGNLIYGLANKPVAPAHLVFIGIVTRAQQNNGEIFIKPQNGFEVRELHDALIETNGNLIDNEVFAYDLTSGLWKNQTAAEAGIQTAITGGATTITSDNLAVNKALISTSGGKVAVSGVTATELAYLASATGNIQSQIDEKISAVTPLTLTQSSNNANYPLSISSANEQGGGAGWVDVIKLTNSKSGAINTNKHIRMNSSGGIEIVNDAYSATIFLIGDNGDFSVSGRVNGSTIGDTGWQSVSSFSNGFTAPTSVAYRRLNNIVYMRGNLNGGTANTGAFTLPSGYRPSVTVVIPVQQYGTPNISYVTVGTDGVVVPNSSSGWLSSIIFPIG